MTGLPYLPDRGRTWGGSLRRVALVLGLVGLAMGAPPRAGAAESLALPGAAGGVAAAEGAAGCPGSARPNRLIDSGSPYLLQHACNAVDWYPWGEEAFEKARRENKPIFLSIGYSTCYWCHVANWTLYSDPAIAALMNAGFVSIKVDREQRPDVDRLFMRATQILGGSGGWPNNLFLTPDLKPFFAGSYFPPADDDFGRPGFSTLLRKIHDAWAADREAITDRATRVHALLGAARAPAAEPVPVSPERWRRAAREAILKDVDPVHGGILGGNEAKFPRAPILELLRVEAKHGHRESRDALAAALDAMALGGIHDHVGGGFHRYAVEPTWSIPHFEKMLDDNAQLLRLYALAHRELGNPLYRETARDVAAFILRDLLDPEGGFYGALDAAVGREEGLTYLWRRAEVDAVLGPDAERFWRAYELREAPPREGDASLEVEPGVLRMRLPSADTLTRTGRPGLGEVIAELAPLRERLREVRRQRPQPARDEKLVVAANGLAIEALALSGRLLGEPAWVEAAARAGERLWRTAYDPGARTLRHEVFRGRARGEGFLDDYALLARGYLALADATRDTKWRRRAARLADDILRHFAEPGGRMASSRRGTDLPLPADEFGDQVSPAGPSAALDVLSRLGGAHRDGAQRLLRAMAAEVSRRPRQWPALLAATGGQESVAAREGRIPEAPAQEAAASTMSGPGTLDKVVATVTAQRGAGGDEIAIHLDIAPGWHVNANPASYPFLIPTQVSVPDLTPLEVIYPKATAFTTRFASGALQVYEGRVSIVAKLPAGSLPRHRPATVQVTTQACSDTVCLPPANVTVSAKPGK
ncbi:MAG: DUF255 domain-containing protein [Betaproteobacteria bacterium]|nr:DUF255 domain-containing protein [Betaproteobacteria bacterium]